jgi:HPt (histidine-containing phosphotransfer) domain-containing protein
VRRDDSVERLPVTLSALRTLIGDNEAAARSIVRNFLTHSIEGAKQLRVACAANRFAAVSDAAHKLKSAAGAIGAFELADLCVQIERASGMGNSTMLAALLVLFNREEASVVAFLATREQEDTPFL